MGSNEVNDDNKNITGMANEGEWQCYHKLYVFFGCLIHGRGNVLLFSLHNNVYYLHIQDTKSSFFLCLI